VSVHVEVVMPSIGRPSLHAALAPLVGRVPVVVVDDRPGGEPLALPPGVRVVRSGGRGPAAARNAGWKASDAEWIAFLDDDVLPPDGWVDALLADLDACAPDVGGTQGRLRVRCPPTAADRLGAQHRRARDAHVGDRRPRLPPAPRSSRSAASTSGSRAPTARTPTSGCGSCAAGWRIVPGRRLVDHPVRPAPWRQSIRSQRGNADDVLMRALHGPRWRELAGVPAGRRPWHLATTAALVTATCGGREGAAPHGPGGGSALARPHR
jgi:glycosyltransferase involved in cell wall biosynthesis